MKTTPRGRGRPASKPPRGSFGDRLRRARLAQGLSCAQLAALLGVPLSTLHKWESGAYSPRSYAAIVALSAHFGDEVGDW